MCKAMSKARAVLPRSNCNIIFFTVFITFYKTLICVSYPRKREFPKHVGNFTQQAMPTLSFLGQMGCSSSPTETAPSNQGRRRRWEFSCVGLTNFSWKGRWWPVETGQVLAKAECKECHRGKKLPVTPVQVDKKEKSEQRSKYCQGLFGTRERKVILATAFCWTEAN